MNLSIEFDNPRGVFLPGTQVTGTVTFSASEPLKTRAVVFSYDGQANSHFKGAEKQTGTHFSSNISYVNGEVTLWSPGKSEPLPAGNHRFPFKFLLPNECPPSFEGTDGHIRYVCRAKIDRAWKIDYTAEKQFTVAPIIDLNLIPLAAEPVVKQDSCDTGILIFKSGKIDVTAKLSKGGYVPGESIVLQADIKNNSGKTITDIEMKLVEISRYTANPKGSQASLGYQSKFSATRTNERAVAQFEETLSVNKSGGSLAYSHALAIPPLAPTFNTCPIVQVEYCFRIRISASGLSSSLVMTLPILIGTVPIRQYSATTPAPAPGFTLPYPGGTAVPMTGPHAAHDPYAHPSYATHGPQVANGPHAPHAPHDPYAPQGLHAPHGPHAPQGAHNPYAPHGPNVPHVSQPNLPYPSGPQYAYGSGTTMNNDYNKPQSTQDYAPRNMIYPDISPSAPPM